MTEARVLAIDAGGTMTDAFVVLEDGRFAVGKRRPPRTMSLRAS